MAMTLWNPNSIGKTPFSQSLILWHLLSTLFAIAGPNYLGGFQRYPFKFYPCDAVSDLLQMVVI